MKDWGTLIRTIKLKNKIELGNAATEMIILQTNPDLTKYNKTMYATAKVMTELCFNINSKKENDNKQAK